MEHLHELHLFWSPVTLLLLSFYTANGDALEKTGRSFPHPLLFPEQEEVGAGGPCFLLQELGASPLAGCSSSGSARAALLAEETAGKKKQHIYLFSPF